MSELRYDPIRGRWTIIATERAFRPHEFRRGAPDQPGDVGACPFEYGNEETTPPEILAYAPDGRPPNGPGWQVRVVANKFPALRVEGELTREGVGIFDRVAGVGAHEVIVETPHHMRPMAEMDAAEIELVLHAWRARLVDLRRDPRIRYALIFKNHGREAGASLYHPHSQLIATPIIPIVVKGELQAAREHWHRKERCIFCDLIHQERALGDRVPWESDHFVLLEPFAASFPFETWILPRHHLHDFAYSPDEVLADLSRVLKDFLGRVRNLLSDPPFNLILHTAPSSHPRAGQPQYWTTIELDYHWHLEFVPRITHIAGFEWGSGYSINPTPPEEAARFLRDTPPAGREPEVESGP
ncbi:MAG TPA: galactose-1-phosphate uridylyltransferase [Thermoanaerobaculaceae bacterium]|nr:galactose-1-phosphate uridylyltransferase [Thermoanaerobaculaceae bacterium]